MKNLKRVNPRKPVCPRCGSLKVKPHTTLSGWLVPEEYLCEECGYRGVALEVEGHVTSSPSAGQD